MSLKLSTRRTNLFDDKKMEKRKEAPRGDGVLVKRQRAEQNGNGTIIKRVERTSGLQAPIMLLSGHGGEVMTVRFDSSGEHIASGSSDKSICLWNTYGDCMNYGVLQGHKGAIMELQWSRDSKRIYSCSTDKTLISWDVTTGTRLKRHKGHTGFVNSVAPMRHQDDILVSGGDDNSLITWDSRKKDPIDVIERKWPITAVSFSHAGDQVFVGGLDNEIAVYDLRRKEVAYSLRGHLDTVSGIQLSKDGNLLVSNGMDNTVRIWDVKPFAPKNRLLKVLEGAPHGFEKNLIKPAWSPDGSQIACGSGDRSVVIWDVLTRRILYKLPGHKGSVVQADFHPEEPIIVSCSTDSNLFLGEISNS